MRRRPSGELGFDDLLRKEKEQGHKEVRKGERRIEDQEPAALAHRGGRNRRNPAAELRNSGELLRPSGGTIRGGNRGERERGSWALIGRLGGGQGRTEEEIAAELSRPKISAGG